MLVLLVDGENKANASLKCEAEPKWHHKKTADNVSIGTTGTTTSFVMKDDLKFTLHEYHDEIKEGNLWLDGFTITDTMRFPAGMYINKDDAAAAISSDWHGRMQQALRLMILHDSNKVVGYDYHVHKAVLVLRILTKQLPGLDGKSNSQAKISIKFAENYEDGEVSKRVTDSSIPN